MTLCREALLVSKTLATLSPTFSETDSIRCHTGPKATGQRKTHGLEGVIDARNVLDRDYKPCLVAIGIRIHPLGQLSLLDRSAPSRLRLNSTLARAMWIS